MATRLKRLAAAALAIVALAAGMALAAPYLVSHQEVRLAALRALRAATGVEPQIGGAVYLAVLPTPSVRIEELRLEDGRRPAFAAAALRASVRLLPLFVGRVEIASLTFEHPHLAVEAAEGGAILVGLPMRRVAGAPPADLPEIRFENGTVLFRGGDGDGEPLADLDAALAWSGAGVNATGSFRWRGQAATFGLSVGDLAALERGNRSSLRLRIEGDGLKLGFDGGVAYRNGVQADGVLVAEARSLRALLAQLTATPPVTRAGFGAFKLKGQLAVAAHSAALTALAIELDGNRADGGLTLKQSGGRTVMQATLATEQADLTPYSGGFAMTDESGRDWSREPIDLSGLDAFDLDVRFSAGRVLVRRTELARVAATVTLRNGALAVAVGDAQFHGGTLRGRAMIGRGADGEAEVKIEGSVAQFDLAPGFAALASLERLEGRGTLALALESRGRHMHALTRGLAGRVALDAGAGALTGINVEQMLRRIERNPLAGAPDFGGGRTAFERLNARLLVREGTARVEEARFESAQMRVRLSGEASVAYRDFDLRGSAMLMRGPAARAEQWFEFPFLVRGPWERPYLLPDPAALFQRSDLGTPFVEAAHRPAGQPDVAAD